MVLEGVGFDGFDRHTPETKRGEGAEALMTAFVNNDYSAVGKHFIKQLEHYVYDAALNNIPGPTSYALINYQQNRLINYRNSFYLNRLISLCTLSALPSCLH